MSEESLTRRLQRAFKLRIGEASMLAAMLERSCSRAELEALIREAGSQAEHPNELVSVYLTRIRSHLGKLARIEVVAKSGVYERGNLVPSYERPASLYRIDADGARRVREKAERAA